MTEITEELKRRFQERYFGEQGILEQNEMRIKTERDFAYGIRDHLVELIESGFLSRNDLVQYSSKHKGTVLEGLAKSVLDLTSEYSLTSD